MSIIIITIIIITIIIIIIVIIITIIIIIISLLTLKIRLPFLPSPTPLAFVIHPRPQVYRIHKFIALLQLLIIIICYIIIHESGSSMKDKYVCSGSRSNGQGAASGGLLGPPWPLLRR